MKKKIGFTLHPKALQCILHRHVFAHVCYVLQELARYLKRTLIPFINWHKNVNKVSKCLEKCVKHDDRKKLAILCCKTPLRVETRAHARVRIFLQNA